MEWSVVFLRVCGLCFLPLLLTAKLTLGLVSRVPMRVARGSVSLLSRQGKGIWPRDMLKKVSRVLSRVEAGNPGFPRLVQVNLLEGE